ncbi:STAS-like domain-containing protein [Mucilaginibacter sp.]|uniref:STAS-like domain-containing protein n=1 Tax=Mucilaginibacter sp. TaxID=1882438 RepID=UPI0026169EDF|nr:STAS-like domain-containing protein [Mucilaginibacter sp.]MDB4918792.1 hypothetical protein [Mucilaginibacter sp.]
MQISVFEILNSANAMFHEDGLKLHGAIMTALMDQESVTVSFEGIKVLTTQFLNASFGKLIVEKGLAFFQDKVEVAATSHLSSYSTKLDWVIDNIKNNDAYRNIMDTVLA